MAFRQVFDNLDPLSLEQIAALRNAYSEQISREVERLDLIAEAKEELDTMDLRERTSAKDLRISKYEDKDELPRVEGTDYKSQVSKKHKADYENLINCLKSLNQYCMQAEFSSTAKPD